MDLTIPLKGEYFDQIKAGSKTEEYRLCTLYWKKRLCGRHYDRLILTRGYPKRDDAERRLVFPWRGAEIRTITHPHFGANPVAVYVINVGHNVQIEGLADRKTWPEPPKVQQPQAAKRMYIGQSRSNAGLGGIGNNGGLHDGTETH